MKKESEIWRFAAERLKRGESVMLLVVAESSGSSPGRQGFKMIVAEDDLIGSVGGGVMEIELVEAARKHLSLGAKDTLIKTLVHKRTLSLRAE